MAMSLFQRALQEDWPFLSNAVNANFNIQASNQKAGFRIWIPESQSWASLDLYLVKTASPVTDLKYRVETDSAGLPSGTLVDVNADTGAFAPPAATGWSGQKNFPAVITVPAGVIWIVVEPITTTTLDATNYWSIRAIADLYGLAVFAASTHNGTVWAAATVNRLGTFVAGLSPSGNWGNPYDNYVTRGITGTGRIGFKIVLDVQTTIRGVLLKGLYNSSMGNDLEVKIFDASNVQQGSTVTIKKESLNAAYSVGGIGMAALTLPAGTYYISLHLVADATGNCYFLSFDNTVPAYTAIGRGNVFTRTADTGAWTDENEINPSGFLYDAQAGGGFLNRGFLKAT